MSDDFLLISIQLFYDPRKKGRLLINRDKFFWFFFRLFHVHGQSDYKIAECSATLTLTSSVKPLRTT